MAAMQRISRKKGAKNRPARRATRPKDTQSAGPVAYPKGRASPALRLPAARVSEQARVPPAIERRGAQPERDISAKRVQRMAVTPADDASEKEAQAVAAKVEAGESAPPITAMREEAERASDETQSTVATARRAGEGEAEPTGPMMPARRRAEEPEGGGTAQAVANRRGRDVVAEQEGLDTLVARQAMQRSRDGRPLDPVVRPMLEKRMGADLGDVEVHSDAASREAADALKARAFTVGNRIYLGGGESERDIPLMAHEATHVVQQSGGSANRQVAQRADGTKTNKQKAKEAAAGADEPQQTDPDSYVHPAHGTIVRKNAQKKMIIPEITLPAFKNPQKNPPPNFDTSLWQKPIKLPKPGSRDTKQKSHWEKAALAGDDLKGNLDAKVKSKPKIVGNDGKQIYYLKLQKQRTYVIGREEDVLPRLSRPYWTPKGAYQIYHVDHIKEDQLGGPDDITNLWLLNARSNTSSGAKIKNEIEDRVATLAAKASPHLWQKPPSVKSLRQTYAIEFTGIKWNGMKIAGDPNDRYTLEDVKNKGKQLGGLKVLDKDEVAEQGLGGSPEKLAIYTNATGGGVRFLSWGTDAQGEKKKEGWEDFYKGFNLTQVDYAPEQGGALHGTLFAKSKVIEEAQLTMPIKELPGTEYGGYVSRRQLKSKLNKLEARFLSPIELAEVDLLPNGVIYVKGLLQPTLPYLKGSPIEIVISGNDIEARKTFSSGDIELPKPFVVSNAEVTVGLGTRGITAEGQVDFGIERVGEGRLAAKRDRETGGLLLDGSFDFQSELFHPATLDVSYKAGEWSGEGTLGIRRGKIKGIKSAEVKAKVARDSFEATGTIVPDIPKVKQGTMHVTYSDKDGFAIGGSLQFGEGIPGIKGGSLEAELTRPAEDEDWKLSGRGQADVDIVGVTGKIDAAYADGAFTIQGMAKYQRGIAAGVVFLGATNRTLDDEGRPTGPPGDRLTAFGSGTVTVTFTPWLQGKLGLCMEPDGHIIVSGEVGLPSTVEVFPQKKYEKNIFSIAIDIPIVGVSVLGKRIGVFATVGGGLDVGASIGPGELRGLKAAVTYDPEKPENTLIAGDARFVIPAQAGLRIFVKGGLGAGIPVVSAEAGLEVGGGFGLKGAAEAAVDVDWTPQQGLHLEARGEVYVEPMLQFDITGYAKVKADLLFKTVTLYNERWKFKEFEFGSGYRFGIIFPVEYVEGEPFDISLDDIEFDVPEIKPKELLIGVVKEVV